jgi:hypothetical protein
MGQGSTEKTLNSKKHWTKCRKVSVPDMRAGHCLGPEGNGVSLGEGSEVGPSPPRGKGDKQSVLNKGRDNMEKNGEERASRM